ncbi:MAG: hypothetical protein DRJ18_01600 [Candidatus Methanomethylicota archaeon]|nr:MAG: hypothetical protein DRJ18_01600 [Candidatus Verstraetearchaeota archaeon]
MYRLKLNNNVTLKRKKIGFRSELIDFIIRKPSLQGAILYDGMLFRNRLLKNYYELIRGLLTNANSGFKDSGGDTRNYRTSGEVARGDARICVGDNTEELDFAGYTLTNLVANTISLAEIIALTSSIEVRLSATAGKTGSIVGAEFYVYNDTGGGFRALQACKLLSVTSGESIIYKLIFNEPWLYNMANWIYGITDDLNAPNEKDMAGVIYTLRSGADANVDKARIVTGDGTDAWSPTDYTLTNPIEHSTTFHYWITDYAVEYVWRTWYIPPSDEQIEEIGLAQKLYDNGGAQHDTLLCRIALGASPLNLIGGNYYIFRLRIVGS